MRMRVSMRNRSGGAQKEEGAGDVSPAPSSFCVFFLGGITDRGKAVMFCNRRAVLEKSSKQRQSRSRRR